MALRSQDRMEEFVPPWPGVEACHRSAEYDHQPGNALKPPFEGPASKNLANAALHHLLAFLGMETTANSQGVISKLAVISMVLLQMGCSPSSKAKSSTPPPQLEVPMDIIERIPRQSELLQQGMPEDQALKTLGLGRFQLRGIGSGPFEAYTITPAQQNLWVNSSGSGSRPNV